MQQVVPYLLAAGFITIVSKLVQLLLQIDHHLMLETILKLTITKIGCGSIQSVATIQGEAFNMVNLCSYKGSDAHEEMGPLVSIK